MLVGAVIGCTTSTEPIAPPDRTPPEQEPVTPGAPQPGAPKDGDHEPLNVRILKSAESGKAPFKVSLTSEVTGGVEPYKYSWDFDSDGSTDAVDPNPDALFASPGIYFIKLTVEDRKGTRGIDTVEVEALFPTPNAEAMAIPSSGRAPLNVNFIAEGSTPQAGASIVEYKWDFNADGIWDYESTSTGNTSYTYNEPGNYYPVLYVKDNLGFWEKTSLKIVVTF